MKVKALFYNFIGFTFFFLLLRYLSVFVVNEVPIYMIVIAAVLANFLSPKFSVVETEKGMKMMMKWIFIKGLREIK